MDIKLFKRKAKKAILNPSSVFRYIVKNTKLANRGTYYSQNAEDVLILDVLRHYKRPITFLDIGSNHPFRFSNTMLIEEKLQIKKGVLVEPNPKMVDLLRAKRGRNKIINKGIGTCNDILTYYFMNADTLNTFSKEEAEMNKQDGYSIIGTKKVEVIAINDLLCSEFSSTGLDYLSIDIEGNDFEVIRKIDYSKVKPNIICVETASMSGALGKCKDLKELARFLKNKGYVIYADTLINTIFVKRDAFGKEFADDIYDVFT